MGAADVAMWLAIKTLRSEVLSADPTLLDRFKQEIRLARKITHPNILRTHDLGETNGLRYLSMEFVKGITLKQLVEQDQFRLVDDRAEQLDGLRHALGQGADRLPGPGAEIVLGKQGVRAAAAALRVPLRTRSGAASAASSASRATSGTRPASTSAVAGCGWCGVATRCSL